MAETITLDRFVTIKIAQLAAKYERHADRYLSQHQGMDIRKWRLLVHLIEWNNNTAAAIATHLNLEPDVIEALLQELAEDGYLSATKHEDGREYHVTDNGKVIYETLYPFMQTRQMRLLGDLDDEQINQLHLMLDHLHDKVDELLN